MFLEGRRFQQFRLADGQLLHNDNCLGRLQWETDGSFSIDGHGTHGSISGGSLILRDPGTEAVPSYDVLRDGSEGTCNAVTALLAGNPHASLMKFCSKDRKLVLARRC